MERDRREKDDEGRGAWEDPGGDTDAENPLRREPVVVMVMVVMSVAFASMMLTVTVMAVMMVLTAA